MTRTLLVGLSLALTGLLVLEWRRSNRRWRTLRLAATLTAGLGLAGLVLPPKSAPLAGTATALTLYTPGEASNLPPGAPMLRVALPHVRDVSPGMPIVPDVGTLRRCFPALRSLRIVGDGLDQAELPALAGLRVEFDVDFRTQVQPGVVFLHAPRRSAFGDPVSIQGQVAGLPPGGTLPVSLQSPDGTTAEATTGPADAAGRASFQLATPAPPAAGCFLWRLRAGDTDEPLGVTVVPPVLPRVLILESAPRFETAALRRWFGDVGGTLVVRTQVGKEVFRTAAARGEAPPLPALDGAVLAGFDLVLSDEPALADLPPNERAALTTAVDQTGLGLLGLSTDAVAPNPPAEPTSLLPWKRTPLAGLPAGEARSVRLRWPGQHDGSELPLPAVPMTLEPAVGQTTLVASGQQQPLVVARPFGRGQLALSLVHGTDRLLRGGDPGAFADYWSHLFTRLSRPQQGTTGRWTLLDGDGGPALVDHPLELLWFGTSGTVPPPAHVKPPSNAIDVSLALAGDPTPTGVWRTTFWPREAGWHHVAFPAGDATLDFYVHPAAAWPAWQQEQRRQATRRFAVGSAAVDAPSKPQDRSAGRIAPAWWFALFFLAVTFLWTEHRFAR